MLSNYISLRYICLLFISFIYIYVIIVNLCELHLMYFLINQSRKKYDLSLTFLLISIIICIHSFFDQIMQTLTRVPLNPLSETLVTLCGLRRRSCWLSRAGLVRMRAALRYENLSFCLRQPGRTWCISGEEILDTGPLSFTFLALLPPPFAS